MSYCLDTSALLDAWVRYYSPDVVPSFWKNLDTLVDAGRVWACRQVLEELKRKDDDAHKWLKDRPQIIVEIDADRFDHYLPLTDLRARLEQRLTLTPSAHRTGGPARYADVAETGGRLGFITPLTGNFCEGCNRVRVTATGQLFPCLGGIEQVDLRAALRSDDPESALDAALDLALRIKPERHHFAIERPGAAPTLDRHMSATGG